VTATFELERFAWTGGAFEVSGRWRAPEAGPLGRARLVLEVDGRRRRIAGQGGRPQAGPEPVAWQGRFPTATRPETVGPAELEVGGGLVIELPAPEVPPEPPPDLREADAVLSRLREERAAVDAAAARLTAERAAAERATAELERARQAVEEAAEAARTEHRVAGEQASEAVERAVREAREAAEAATRRAVEEAREAAERVVREARQAPAPPTQPLPTQALPTQALPTRPLPPPEPPPTTTPRREAIREALERPHQPRGTLPQSPRSRRGVAYALALLIVIVIVLLARLLL
jgi:hypothetical protein